MNLFSLPDPVSMFESAVNGKLERKAANALISSTLSGWLSFMWSLGARNLLGFGPAFRALATAEYLTLQQQETKDFLTLTVPQEMLSPNNLALYQTSYVKQPDSSANSASGS